MRNLLPLIPKASRYTGIEDGAVRKDPRKMDFHCALAFPDAYEVGMSYLGQKILYSVVNNRENWLAERVMAPCRETAEILRSHHKTLCTLESGTPLSHVHLLGFSITHELCYTNILYMLELAKIPLKSCDRGPNLFSHPIVIAGGGATLSAEPMADFMDLMVLGEGEETTVDLADLLIQARKANMGRDEFLDRAGRIPGVYVPSFFSNGPDGHITALKPECALPSRRIVPDLDNATYPVRQVAPIGAVHNRLALEIARGCTRGCRFCHAGMVYRPARERKLENILDLLEDGLKTTGFEEVSFLSLSTGDFSALKSLCSQSFERCASEQVALSLPSLRVGSVDESIMELMAKIRRTGITLAPEAGSERLRRVINKGITEEELLEHLRKLADHGWQQVKLYFMIGLPTETMEDLDAIVELCRKSRDAAGRGKPRLQVTAAISPFVPKPFTPFQWESQLTLEEMENRISYLRTAFKSQKCLTMRWHNPAMSHLEGILSRGDRRLGAVVEEAYKNGAIFDSWAESFNLAPWLAALEKHGLTPEGYTGARSLDAPLPWDHLNAGIKRSFLLKERERSYAAKYSADCRYNACRHCGVCDTKAGPSLLPRLDPDITYSNKLNFSRRDQAANDAENETKKQNIPLADATAACYGGPHTQADEKVTNSGTLYIETPEPAEKKAGRRPMPPRIKADLAVKAARLRIWHNKEGLAAFLSQLELQAVLERAIRRAALPMAFSQGFHPLPLISFGRALPVGVESLAEWFAITLREIISAGEVKRRLSHFMPEGLGINAAIPEPVRGALGEAWSETFTVGIKGDRAAQEAFAKSWNDFYGRSEVPYTRLTKKGEKAYDLRSMVSSIKIIENSYIQFITDWRSSYISPLVMCMAISGEENQTRLNLVKISQNMAESGHY